MNHLICPNCGNRQDSIFRAAVCVECGNVAVIPPLTEGEFEKVGEDNEPIKPEPKKRPASGISRTPEDGGRVF